MILYPAIDLKDGRCVRLIKGDMSQATVFNDSPADQARQFVAAGCEWIHVVDLDGAFAGKAINAAAVRAIIAAGVPVQLGGGIRDIAAVEMWLEAGLARVILGTAAVKDPTFVRAACKAFPGRVAVGIDARCGKVATEGWAQTAELTAEELAKRFTDAGVAALIHTDIDRDGVLAGPNIPASAALARAVPIPVIVSGGVSSIADIAAAKAEAASGIAGIIAGRALYEGRLSLGDAIALLKG